MKRLSLGLITALFISTGAWAGGYGHHSNYGFSYGHHGQIDDGDALLAGLVIGGLVGWFLNEDRYYARNHNRYRSYDSHRPLHRHDYNVSQHVHPRPVPSQTSDRVGTEFSNCMMTREYTTTIDIDGTPQAVYGTRCMQADGSWVLGAPKLAPVY